MYEHKDELFSRLLPVKAENQVPVDSDLLASKVDAIIVLDDDPTGTQTVHGVPVLTSWSIEILKEEFRKNTPLFYLLTNSRSLTEEASSRLTREIGNHIRIAAGETNTRYWVISRGDSTLRGHYPSEIEVLQRSLELENSVQFIIPAFFEGGRYTIDDVHYVEQEGSMVSASETIYAKDHVFGYSSSNLVDWVLEKTNGTIDRSQIVSLDLKSLRSSGPEKLIQKLNALDIGSVCIVNAAEYADLHCFSKAILKSDVTPVFRTAASFVASLGGIHPRPLLEKEELIHVEYRGGLIIVGSYVETTTRQLQFLLEDDPSLIPLELNIPQLLHQPEDSTELCAVIGQEIDEKVIAGQTVVLYTSRNLVSAGTTLEKQLIGKRVSGLLTDIVKKIEVQPSFILTKGGITSSDIATSGLGIQRANVLGQIIKGVPVWQLGQETKFPNSLQIIFPGNVGEVSSLAEIVRKLTP